MKQFSDMIAEQTSDVNRLRKVAIEFILPKVTSRNQIIGALLTGSVARGDARISPWGLYIDIAIVLNDDGQIDLDAIFGKNEEPYIPKHCINLFDKVGIAIEVTRMAELLAIRKMSESSIFAKNESQIIYDPENKLKFWKDTAFQITEDEIRNRSLQQYFRLDYLVNDYRMEKWSFRKAFVQIAQNFNEAAECYLMFLYCINSYFVPRKDWLVYLSFELAIKPDIHEDYVQRLYFDNTNVNELESRGNILILLQKWMLDYCRGKTWL